MPASSRDSGFTLIELIVVMSLLGVMMAIAVGGWSTWANASAHSGTAREIQSVLTQAHQRAITEGTSMCVWFDIADDSYTVYRGACAEADKDQILGPYTTESGGVFIAAADFGSAPGVTMRARGTADAGSVTVKRVGSTKEYTVIVEGLTSRVTIR